LKKPFCLAIAIIFSVLLFELKTPAASAIEITGCLGVDSPLEVMDLNHQDDSCIDNLGSVIFQNGVILSMPNVGEETMFVGLTSDGIENQIRIWRNAQGLVGAEENQTFYGEAYNVAEPYNSNIAPAINDSLGNTDLGCLSQSYSPSPWRHYSVFSWWYNPLNESSIRALDRIKAAMNLWRFPTNRCTGESFATNFQAAYQGLTSSTSSLISASGEYCKTNFDGKNVISWGKLPSRFLGGTCVRRDYLDNVILETDIRLSVDYTGSFFDYSSTYQCGIGDYLLVNVAAHEIGHAIGFEHSSADYHQLMSPNATECTHDFVGLAPGDYLGLQQKYGVLNDYQAV